MFNLGKAEAQRRKLDDHPAPVENVKLCDNGSIPGYSETCVGVVNKQGRENYVPYY